MKAWNLLPLLTACHPDSNCGVDEENPEATALFQVEAPADNLILELVPALPIWGAFEDLVLLEEPWSRIEASQAVVQIELGAYDGLLSDVEDGRAMFFLPALFEDKDGNGAALPPLLSPRGPSPRRRSRRRRRCRAGAGAFAFALVHRPRQPERDEPEHGQPQPREVEVQHAARERVREDLHLWRGKPLRPERERRQPHECLYPPGPLPRLHQGHEQQRDGEDERVLPAQRDHRREDREADTLT